MGELGSSCVVIAGSLTRLRLHAHVASPSAMFELAARFGRVEGAKADDMHAQQRTASGAAARRVAILADSACDLPDALIEAHNIHVVPLRVNFGEQDFLDKVGLGTGDFYARMRASDVLPRTSQPPPGDFRRQMEFLLSHSPSLVYVGLSRAVSGTLQSAETAAARTDARRARVVDSANASGGLALLALRAAELAGEGRDADAIVAELERLRPLTLTWAVARDLSHGVRGGRVPAWAKPLIQGLGLTPVVRFSPEGKLKVAGALWGTRDVPARFARHVAKRLPPGQRWRVIVGHADARADGEALLAAVDAAIAPAERWLVETGPAIGAHAGQGALVIAVQPLP
jgi:DegV family protein with EDD domain